jgi:hypothetical protein
MEQTQFVTNLLATADFLLRFTIALALMTALPPTVPTIIAALFGLVVADQIVDAVESAWIKLTTGKEYWEL